METLLSKAVEKIIFLEIKVVLKPIRSTQLPILYVGVIPFRDDVLLQVDQERSLSHLSALDNPAEDQHLVFVFVVVETTHVLECRDLFWLHLSDVESRAYVDLLPDKPIRFRNHIIASPPHCEHFHKLLDVDPFEVVLHISVGLTMGVGCDSIFTGTCVIAPNGSKSLPSCGDISKCVDVPVLNDAKSDSFSLVLKAWNINPSIIFKSIHLTLFGVELLPASNHKYVFLKVDRPEIHFRLKH